MHRVQRLAQGNTAISREASLQMCVRDHYADPPGGAKGGTMLRSSWSQEHHMDHIFKKQYQHFHYKQLVPEFLALTFHVPKMKPSRPLPVNLC